MCKEGIAEVYVRDPEYGDIVIVVDDYGFIPGQKGSRYQEHIEPELEITEGRVYLDEPDGPEPCDADFYDISRRHAAKIEEALKVAL